MKEIIKDYFYDFYRGFKLERFELISYISIGIFYTSEYHPEKSSILVGLPIIFAMLSGAFHMVSLPFMMYLVPYSRKEREAYIQKMLYVKILFPLLVTLLCDFIVFLQDGIPVYNLVLQISGVCIITYISGTLNDGTIESWGKKAAYGKFKDVIGVPLIFCYLAAPVLFMVCMDSINTTEFFLILGGMLLIFAPVIHMIHKRWKILRGNFADYEIATKLEVRNANYH